MITNFKKPVGRTLFLWMVLALFSLPASALDLKQAKAQNLVKETPTGYLVAVKPSSEVETLIKKINNARKAEYQKIAQKRGTSLNAVEQLAGERLSQ